MRSHEESICCREREGQPADDAMHVCAIHKPSEAAEYRRAPQLATAEPCVCLRQGRVRVHAVCVRGASRAASRAQQYEGRQQ